MRSDDVAELIAARGDADIGFHQGVVLAWNVDTGANTISVDGVPLSNLPPLATAGFVALRKGDTVGILKVKHAWFILGRIVVPGSALAQPQWPVVLYPQYQSSVALGTAGYSQVAAGTLVSWEGRIKPSHPRIEVDGIWGQASGSNTTTYSLQLGGNEVGAWTISGSLDVNRHGPFDITGFIGQDWLKVEIKMTASTGTGQVAFQPLGVYMRQS